MPSIARDGFTESEILAALHGKNGSIQLGFRFDLIRDGAVLSHLPATGSVRMDRNNLIQRTAKFTIYGECGIDWLRDLIRPIVILRMPDDVKKESTAVGGTWKEIRIRKRSWKEIRHIRATWADIAAQAKTIKMYESRFVEFPMGLFILSTPTRQYLAGGITYEVEAYDRTLIFSEDCILNRYFISSGKKYTQAVEEILATTVAATNVIITHSDFTLPTSVDFAMGTSKLEMINTLLNEAIYESLYADETGAFMVSPYIEPTPNNITLRYTADELSVIEIDTRTEMDTFNVPNVFKAVVSNPETGIFSSVYINDNPASKLSTTYRGRNITSEIYKPDRIPNSEALDAYIRKIAFDANQVEEVITFQTGIMPIHGNKEILAIQHPSINGTYCEQSWEIQLEPNGKMSHTAKRLVVL